MCQKATDNPTASLVSIPDKITNDFLNSLTMVETWAGGYLKSEGQWAWTDGSEWKYTNWAQGQPNNRRGVEDVLVLRKFEDGWNDGNKSTKYGSLCQYNPRQ